MVKTKSLTEGPIFSRLFFFTLPLIATGLLQVFYNMADSIVVGSFSGDELALAATGSTASLTALIVNILLGFATGGGVVIAQHFGAKDHENLERTVHTASALAIIGGILFGAIAFIFAEDFLILMGTQEVLLSRATLYFRIIALGIPASTIFNFGAAILRSVGNSKIQLYILSSTGLANVLLNLMFVICFGMTVDGVALATIISQYLSAIAAVIVLLKWKDDSARLNPRKIKIHGATVVRILKIALPTCLQSTLFSISNVLIQTAANGLPTLALSAKTIAGNIDNFVYTAIYAFSNSTMPFVAQNYGAKKFDRIKKIILISAIQIVMVGVVLGQSLLFFGADIAALFIDAADPNKAQIIEYSLEIMRILLNIYFMCGIMDMLSASLRGLGNSIVPMIIGIVGICGIRLVWIFFFFPMEPLHNLTGLYLSYPITWVFCITALVIALMVTWKKKINPLIAKQNETVSAQNNK
jgi:putative MATE family efflux protein